MKLAWLGILALGVMVAACEVYDPAAPSSEAPAAQPSSQALTATANAPSPAGDQAQPAANKPSACCGSSACLQAKADKGTCPCRAAAMAAGADMPSCGGAEH